MAFIPLSKEAQVKSKLIIDGIGSRFGRGASSLISILLFGMFGLAKSSIGAGIIALFFTGVWIRATRQVSTELTGKKISV